MEQGSREQQGTWGYHGLSKGKKGRLIQLEKEDSNKQFIWFKISENGNIIRIATCYLVSRVSKTYKGRGLNHKDPFATLKNNIAAYSQLSEVLLVGDFNARTVDEIVIDANMDLQ